MRSRVCPLSERGEGTIRAREQHQLGAVATLESCNFNPGEVDVARDPGSRICRFENPFWAFSREHEYQIGLGNPSICRLRTHKYLEIKGNIIFYRTHTDIR